MTATLNDAPASSLVPDTERCDRCGHRAYVIVSLMEGHLSFCAHHFADHEPALRRVALDIRDNRAALYRRH